MDIPGLRLDGHSSGAVSASRSGGAYGRDIEQLLRKKTPAGKRAALKRASEEFEAVFLRQMIAAMRKTVGEGGLLKKSNGEKIFEGMLDDQWSRELATHTGTGSLSELLYRQLSHQMGLDDEETAPKRAMASVPQGGLARSAAQRGVGRERRAAKGLGDE